MSVRHIEWWPILGSILCLLTGCMHWQQTATDRSLASVSVPREFRAAWVASVSNINWPSKRGLNSGQQQAEAIEMLDMLQNLHFNAVILQSAPNAMPFTPANWNPGPTISPGSRAKRRSLITIQYNSGLTQPISAASNCTPGSIPIAPISATTRRVTNQLSNKGPSWSIVLITAAWWLDPALKETQDYSCSVIMDVVRRYDIDGVHFDDYFYPYPSYNDGRDFPDDPSWQAYVDSGGKLSRADWRRQAVNQFIKRVYHEIKQEKRFVKFGLSPFGIWRPGYPETISGLDQYHALYADARLWLNKGWVDYWTPQLYWPIGKLPQSFPLLLGWWQDENHQHRHLWPGINVSKGNEECINQIMVTRGMVRPNPGVVHWSIGSVKKNPELQKALLAGPYARQALVPPPPGWISARRFNPSPMSRIRTPTG